MKILHSADWHVGKKLENFSRIKEQTLVLGEICSIADSESVDAVVISGDLFDTYNPASEAIELFYRTVKQLTREGTRPVVAISGNHDSPDRIETADPLARECGIIFLGYPNSKTMPFKLESGLELSKTDEGFVEFNVPTANYPLRIITTPYANEFRLKQALNVQDKEADLRDILQNRWAQIANKYCDNKGVNILATHLFVVKRGQQAQEESDDERPILHVGGAQVVYADNFPPQVQYVALGHLHRKQIIASDIQPVVYSGSPLSYSFAETNQQKYVMIVEVKPGKKAEVLAVELKQGKGLLRLRADGMKEAEELLLSNQDKLIELTLKTDAYISAADRQHLNALHSGIVTLIPQLKTAASNQSNSKNIDIGKDFTSLFTDYFKHVNGLEPNPSILSLLNEVIADQKQNA
ncbi:Exodeoxyribonuclease I subunit D [Saccharicrinis carchari]|uniref:Nuclease SbcCD subunit D n=1 Tax=Saccharicrinis carchari TaxID=1168039 RepID=A0A521DMC8_SACCC|nr:exonuclease subunit SbcD [Saccharicrinis carchari]SMO72836.1 Exodeoxyribonuclease I subunit D [Saccharicrinis carchari]